MRTTAYALCCIILCALAGAGNAFSFGEGVLGLKGEYTFFIKPDPNSCVTYYQRLVPCVKKQTIMVDVPVKTRPLAPVPVPREYLQRVAVAENPAGCAEGSTPCVQCFPQSRCSPGSKTCVGPQLMPVPVGTPNIQPRCITRKVMRPQWFAVQEHPLPPQPTRRIRKVDPRG